MKSLLLCAALFLIAARHSENAMLKYEDLDCGDCVRNGDADEAGQATNETDLKDSSI